LYLTGKVGEEGGRHGPEEKWVRKTKKTNTKPRHRALGGPTEKGRWGQEKGCLICDRKKVVGEALQPGGRMRNETSPKGRLKPSIAQKLKRGRKQQSLEWVRSSVFQRSMVGKEKKKPLSATRPLGSKEKKREPCARREKTTGQRKRHTKKRKEKRGILGRGQRGLSKIEKKMPSP